MGREVRFADGIGRRAYIPASRTRSRGGAVAVEEGHFPWVRRSSQEPSVEWSLRLAFHAFRNALSGDELDVVVVVVMRRGWR